MSFKKEIFAKWILAGEHSVLRGSPSLVFPFYLQSLKISFEDRKQDFSLIWEGKKESRTESFFLEILEKSLKLVQKDKKDLKGLLRISNSIDFSQGLGGSAAISVGISSFFHHLNWIDEKSVFPFSLKLENIFHGKASGVDVFSCFYSKPSLYFKDQKSRFLEIKQKAHLYLHSSGLKSETFKKVKNLEKMKEKDPELFSKIDQKMEKATYKALEFLENKKELCFLKQSMDEACECFYQWDLIPFELDQKIKKLKNKGALSVKPTGAGGGGYLLSLWDRPMAEKAFFSAF